MPIKILDFRPYKKNTLQGFINVELQPTGLEIRDLSLHEKNGKRWVNMPSRPYEDNGETKYSYIVYFSDKDRSIQFQDSVLKALDEFQPPKTQAASEDPPF